MMTSSCSDEPIQIHSHTEVESMKMEYSTVRTYNIVKSCSMRQFTPHIFLKNAAHYTYIHLFEISFSLSIIRACRSYQIYFHSVQYNASQCQMQYSSYIPYLIVTSLYCSILYRTLLYSNAPHCAILHCTALYRTVRN